MSRPGTPLRRYSQSRVADSLASRHYDLSESTPLESPLFANSIIELDDGVAQLDANLQRIQQIHESVQCFNESFSAFLYGIQMNAWCVEFPEAPTHAAFERNAEIRAKEQREKERIEAEERRRRELELQEEEKRQQELLRKQKEDEEARLLLLQRQNERQTTRQHLKRPANYSQNRPKYGRPAPKTRVVARSTWK